MQKNNSFKINIYTLLFNPFRLTLLILFVFLCSSQFGCRKNEKSEDLSTDFSQIPIENAIDINSASFEELKKLPKVGDELAAHIIAHREKNGKFRRVEQLILVRGMTDKKFREIKNLVKAE